MAETGRISIGGERSAEGLLPRATKVYVSLRYVWNPALAGRGKPSRLRKALVGSGTRARYEEAACVIALYDALMELVRVLSKAADLTPVQREKVSWIGKEIDKWWSPESSDQSFREPDREEVWQLVGEVEHVTVEVAETDWIRRRLELEADHRSAAHGANGAVQWSAVFHDKAKSWAAEVSDPAKLEGARQRLLRLNSFRAHAARQHRAAQRVRSERLLFTGILTAGAAILVAGLFALATHWQSRPAFGPGYVLARSALALFAGGLGGALARTLRLRDAPLGTFEAGRFRRGFWAQMAIGGAFGVVAMVLVEIGGLPRIGNGSDAAMVALYAFLVGWSEPFILNLLYQLAPDEGPRPIAQPQRSRDSS
jgi:hypothetical protein